MSTLTPAAPSTETTSTKAENKAAKAANKAAKEALAAVRRTSRKPTWVVALLILILVANVASIFAFAEFGSRELTGAMCVLLMLVLLFFRVPIAFTLIIPAGLGMLALQGTRALESIMSGAPYGSVSVWQLSALPMFILMGMVLASSGIADRVYYACRLWFGWVPGGTAVATNMAGGGMASISGSTLGTAYALGRIGIPQMFKEGYDRRLAVGAVISSALPGQVLPPSLSLIFIAGIMGTAVGPQLLSGIVPGVSMIIIMAALIIVIASIWPAMAGRSKAQRAARIERDGPPPAISWGERFKSLGGIWPMAVLFITLFGALYGGVLTASEAGAAGALAASILCIFFRRKDKPLSFILEGARRAVSTVGAIFLVLVGAHMLTQLIAVTGLGRLFAETILSLGLDRIGFLLIVMLVYFLLGTFMEPLPIYLLTIPILMPVFGPLGIDPLWFGVFAVIMGEIAILSPPVGILTFLVHGLVQDKKINMGQKISLTDVYNASWMLMPGFVVLLLVMIFFPDIVTWLAYSSQQ